MLRLSSSKLSPSAPASFNSRFASARDFSMSGQNPASFCSSSFVAASGDVGKTMPPTVCTLAILAISGAVCQRSIAKVSARRTRASSNGFFLWLGSRKLPQFQSLVCTVSLSPSAPTSSSRTVGGKPPNSISARALRSARADIESRGFPPTVRDELVGALGDKLTVQTSDWNCGSFLEPNHKKKPFDDARVRRALTLAIDRWHTAPEIAKIANVHTVGGIVFPNSSLAATKEELQKLAGFWPDIEKSRAEARRLLKEAGAEGLSFELLNRNIDQPYKYNGSWVIDDWSKIGLHVTQKVAPTGPWFEAMRSGNFDVTLAGNCQTIVNPVLDVQRYLPTYEANYGQFEDQPALEIYKKMLREPDPAKQRALMRQFEKNTLDDQAHEIFLLWWERIVPHHSYVKGWKISPSHYLNQDLATVWLDK